MLRDDIIIRLPLRPIVKCEIDLHNSALACPEQNLLSEYSQVSSNDCYSILRCVEQSDGIPKETAQMFHL